MVALASTNVTVTVNERRIVGKKRRNRVTVTYGDAALTYPTGGVPFPAFGSFGMIRQLDYVILVDPAKADGFVYKYDVTNNKLLIYVEQAVGTNTPLAEATTGLAPAATTLVGEAVGW